MNLGLLEVVIIAAILPILVVPIICLVYIQKNKNLTGQQKGLWSIAVLFTGLLGVLFYYLNAHKNPNKIQETE